MIGNPKFTYGDIVKFEIGGETKTGIIAIIDAYGTFFDDTEVSYDILVKEENILYKHMRESKDMEKVDHIDFDPLY